MIKHGLKHAAHAAMMVLAVGMVASCGENSAGGKSGIGQTSAFPAAMTATSYQSIEDDLATTETDDEVMLTHAVMTGSIDEIQATAAELRHFAIYTNYVAQASSARIAVEGRRAASSRANWVVSGKLPGCPDAGIGM